MVGSLIILSFCATASVVFLFQLRRKPKPVGETPHCGGCGYSLTGNQSGRCPECGLELTEANIVVGDYPRRLILPLLLLASLAGVVYFGQRAIRLGDWYSYRPTHWVIEDAYSPTPDVADRAWQELRNRRASGKLHEDAENRITELALASYAMPRGAGGPLEPKLIEFLAERYQSGKLSPAQVDRLYSESFSTQLHVRPKIVAGDELPIDAKVIFRAGGGFSRTLNKTASVGGRVLGRHDLAYTAARFSGPLTAIRIDKPGIYDLTVEEDFSLQLIPPKQFSEPFPWTRHLVWTARVEVLEKAPPDLIKWIDQPHLLPVLEKLIVANIDADATGNSFIRMHIFQPPINLAMDVFARIDGRDVLIGKCTAAKGEWNGFTFHLPIEHAEKVDLVLRSSASAARITTDLFEIWKGEIVLKDVKLRK